MDSNFMEHYFQQAHNLQYFTWDNEDEWLKLRQPYFGGSDIGIILGLYKYRSKLSLYKEKVEGIVQEVSDNVYIKKGKDLEALIREYYVRPYLQAKGYFLHHFDFMLVNKLYPHLAANLDGFAEYDNGGLVFEPEKNIVIEIKWVSRYGEDNWGNDDGYYGVPPSYYAQVQQYMLITGCKKAIVCALFDKDWSMHYYEVPRDDMFLTNLINESLMFKNYIDYKIAPPLDSALDNTDIYDSIVEDLHNPTPKVESLALAEAIDGYLQTDSSIKELETRKKKYLDIITNEVTNGATVPTGYQHNAFFKPVTSTRFNTSKFKEEHPELYEKYCMTVQSLRTTIK